MADKPEWTFLSNHGHVLVCLSRNPQSRLRDIAEEVGITERRVAGIIADLEAGRIVQVKKVGRRNEYTINSRAKLRHAVESAHTVGELIQALG